MSSGYRDSSIDYVKGVAIFLMVACHASLITGCAGRLVNSFHMPVFLMASGYFFNVEKLTSVDGWKKFVYGKLKRLWLPYVFWMVIFILMHNLFVKAHFYDDPQWSFVDLVRHILPVFTMHGGTDLLGPLWFVQVLFFIVFIYAFVSVLCARLRLNQFVFQSVLAALFLLFGKYVHAPWLNAIGRDRFLVCYSLYYLGSAMAFCDSRFSSFKRRLPWRCLAWLTVLLVVVGSYENVAINGNNYRCGITLLMTSVCGWIFLRQLSLFRYTLARCFCYLGKHTMPILLFHLLVFKLISWAFTAVTGGNPECLTGFPTPYTGLAWGLAYSLSGIALPLALNVCYGHLLKSSRGFK